MKEVNGVKVVNEVNGVNGVNEVKVVKVVNEVIKIPFYFRRGGRRPG